MIAEFFDLSRRPDGHALGQVLLQFPRERSREDEWRAPANRVRVGFANPVSDFAGLVQELCGNRSVDGPMVGV